jgi:hypothetical protein
MKEITEKTNSHAKENYNKSGKLAKRKELRRLEELGRQIERVERMKKNAAKAKNKKDAQKKVDHAELTLQMIRGGTPHDVLISKFKAAKAAAKAEEAAK